MPFLAARLWRSMLLPKPRSTGCRCKRIPKAAATVEEVGQVATVDLKEEERLVAQLVPLLVAAKLQWIILRPSSSGHVAKASQAARALLSSFVSERSGAAGMLFADIQLQKDKQQYMGAERPRKQRKPGCILVVLLIVLIIIIMVMVVVVVVAVVLLVIPDPHMAMATAKDAKDRN